MLEVAIVGAGVAGLSLAHALQGQGIECALFEARGRVGGRVLTRSVLDDRGRVDLGPTWYWPPSQPQMVALLDELGLKSFAQHDEGEVLLQDQAGMLPTTIGSDPIHRGARRVEGGMGSLVRALRERLTCDVHLAYRLTGISDHGDHVELQFEYGRHEVEIKARHVVLAMPPRLLLERVQWSPSLPQELAAAMGATPTWMANQAKIVAAYPQPHWRERGYAGSAFVQHAQAVMGEVFDASDASARAPALGGFVAMPPEQRKVYSAGLTMLASSQLAQLFGDAHGEPEVHFQDWSAERFTCSDRDRVAGGRPDWSSHPLLRKPLWMGRVLLAGTETGSYEAGHIEGALDSAQRTARTLRYLRVLETDALSAAQDEAASNHDGLASFEDWLQQGRARRLQGYKDRLHDALSGDDSEMITQRALLETIEAQHRDALACLDTLPLHPAGVAVERGCLDLTRQVQASIARMQEDLLSDALQFNGMSCALSNFPDEHRPSADYVEAIRRDLSAAFREFSWFANAVLIGKAWSSTARTDFQRSTQGVFP